MTKRYKRKWLHKGGIIRQRGKRFQVEINFNSKRIRKAYETREEAQRFIEQKRTGLSNGGLDSMALAPEQRADASLAIKELPPNTTLSDAVKHYARAASKLDGSPLDTAPADCERYWKIAPSSVPEHKYGVATQKDDHPTT